LFEGILNAHLEGYAEYCGFDQNNSARKTDTSSLPKALKIRAPFGRVMDIYRAAANNNQI